MKLQNLCNEQCCEYCQETVHKHFDCPVCKTKGAGALSGDGPIDLYEWKEEGGYGEGGSITIECEECGAEFETTAIEGSMDEWEWKQTGGKVEVRTVRK